MRAIIKREINAFFSSTIGFLVIGVFLVLNGLFLWVFKSNFNIFDFGFADLSSYFGLAPWILLFLIPAITMKSFSDEKKMGTLELLLIRPIGHWKIVLGKYFGSLILIIIALIPTLLYIWTIWELGNPIGNMDMGSTLGSYFGMFFLVAAYTSIGIFASSLSENQIVSFIIAVLVCFSLYYGFEAIAQFNWFNSSNLLTESFGLKAHFDSIGRGVIDTRDIIYFISVTVFFLFLTVINLKKQHSI